MSDFNLSEWAVRHRSLVVYFMLVLAVAGVGSYLRLGRNEDPAFTIRTMVVQANWPGATIQRHAPAGDGAPGAQAPGDAEPRLSAQLHQRRPDHDLRQPEGLDAGQGDPGYLVPGPQEDRRHPQHPATRHRRARLQRRVRRHLRHRLRFHGGRLQPSPAEGPCRGRALAPAAGAGRVQDRRRGRAG